MIQKTISNTRSKIVIYFNSDILFHKNVIYLIRTLSRNKLYTKKLLIVGKRGDIYWKNVSHFVDHDVIWKNCALHSGSGIDYFIFTKYTFSISDIKILNEIVVGRIRYDNIILSLALKSNKSIVFDSTKYVKAIHLSVSYKEKNELIKVFSLIYNF